MEAPKTFYAKTRKEWRAWLQRNHDGESMIGLIRYKKHTGKPSPTHREAREEAICFGWIDSTIKRLDDERYVINFVRRGRSGRWSENTLRYAKDMIKRKKMHPAGLRAFKHGLSKPAHDSGIPKNPLMSQSLAKALNKTSSKNFASFPPSYRSTLLRWLLKAKLPETKARRIKAIAILAKNNDKKSFFPAA